MRRDRDNVMVKSQRQDATEMIRCDTWARRVQLELSHNNTRNSGMSGCIEVNFSLF